MGPDYTFCIENRIVSSRRNRPITQTIGGSLHFLLSSYIRSSFNVMLIATTLWVHLWVLFPKMNHSRLGVDGKRKKWTVCDRKHRSPAPKDALFELSSVDLYLCSISS